MRVAARVLAGLLIFGLAGCGGSAPGARESAADRAAIEALHRRDQAAVMSASADSLVALWTDDIVSMPALGPIVRGKAANAELLRAALAQPGEHRPLTYELHFEELKILGDVAYEWGTYQGSATVGADTMVGSGKLMRVLARDSTGTWRVARTIFTADPVTKR